MKTYKTTPWLSVHFYTSIYNTDQFIAFSRDFRSDLRSMVKIAGWEVESVSVQHFYIYGFLQNADKTKMLYFSIPDVRSFHNEWASNMLVRTAEHNKDWTGGRNEYVKFRLLDLYLTTL